MVENCQCGCGGAAKYYWFDGLWVGPAYCESHIREKLDPVSETDRVTRSGAQPIDGDDVVVKTLEGLEWVDA